MKHTFWLCAALVGLGANDNKAEAWDCSCVCFCPPLMMTFEARKVTCYRMEWREEKVPIVIQKMNYRQENTKVKVTYYVPKFFDHKVSTSYYVPVPKLVTRDQTTCVMVPFMMVDPCAGCCYMTCCPQRVTSKVTCTEYDAKLQTREVVVKVCKMVAEDRMVDQTRFVPEVSQEKSWTIRRTCIPVAYQATIYVPVFTPCLP